MKNILKCLIFYTVFINSQFFCFGRAEFSSKSTKLMQNKINVYYQKEFSPGDPIFVVAKISRDKKDGNSQNITKIKIHLFQKQDDNEEKKIESSELYCINAGFPQKKADLFIGGLPASSFLKNGKYYIKPEFFTDMVLDDLCERYNLEDLNVRYSLGYCQGDGLCLLGRININNFIDNCIKNKSSYSNEELSILRYLSNAGLDITLEQYLLKITLLVVTLFIQH